MTSMTSPKRPNLLIIMSDDQGPWAMNCAGTPEIRTPTLDHLAATGVRFDHFFCTSPVCSPARASFLTGTIPSRHGVHDWIKLGNISVADGVTWCGADEPIEYLAGQLGFTDLLAADGYRCGLSGKWHLGDSARPQKGHTWWYAHSLGGAHYMDYHAFDNSPELVHKTAYVTDYYADRAGEFLQQYGREDRPFCLSLHFTAPHAPWSRDNHPPELFDSYADCAFASIPREAPHPWHGWDPSPQARQEALQGYFAAVTGMDRAIARVLAKLDELGIRDDTLIVFLADNGFNLGHHGICGKGNGTSPLNMYEESVKVPFLISWPGHVPQGVVESGLYSQYDFLPTLLDLLGLEHPAAASLPGRSFAGVLRGRPDAGGERVVVFDEYGPARMIRDQQWKYVHRYPDGPDELYDLRADPGERRNLVDQRRWAATVEHLRGQLETWFRRYADPNRDGALLPVSGRGQIDQVGRVAAGRVAFV